MKLPVRFRFLLLLLAAAAAPMATLHAQATKIFVASYGNDANDGSRGAPKRNFQPAHNAVAAGGDIVVLDTAGYGALTISKSVNVTVPPGVNGFVTVSSGTAITVATASGDRVSLRGLVIEGTGGGSTGINCTAVNTLELSDCVLQGFVSDGVTFLPGSSARLVAERCTFRACGFRGCFVYGVGTATARATFVGCQFVGCNYGLAVDITGSTAAARISARDCTASGNAIEGFALTDAQAELQNCTVADNFGTGVTIIIDSSTVATATLLGCTVSNNAVGVKSSGTGATARLDACVVTNNTTNGLQQANNGVILSRSNNTIAGNTSNTAFGTYAAQ